MTLPRPKSTLRNIHARCLRSFIKGPYLLPYFTCITRQSTGTLVWAPNKRRSNPRAPFDIYRTCDVELIEGWNVLILSFDASLMCDWRQLVAWRLNCKWLRGSMAEYGQTLHQNEPHIWVRHVYSPSSDWRNPSIVKIFCWPLKIESPLSWDHQTRWLQDHCPIMKIRMNNLSFRQWFFIVRPVSAARPSIISEWTKLSVYGSKLLTSWWWFMIEHFK